MTFDTGNPNRLKDPCRFWGVGEVLRLSIPASLSMLSMVMMQFVDGLMVSRIPGIGPAALSAQVTGGISHFTCMSIMFGTLTVVNTFVAQNFGAGRPDRCSQYTWQGLYLAWAYALVMLPLAYLAPRLFAAIGHSSEIRAMEVMYFRYMVFGSALFLSSSTMDRFFYGTHRPRVVLAATIAANAFNVLGDYVLIYGKLGFPAMGLRGAAIATLCSAGLATAIMGAMFLLTVGRKRYHSWRQRGARLSQIRDILRVGWPAGLQHFIDVLGWTVIITILVGRVATISGQPDETASDVHLAATAVAIRYMHVSFMPAIGVSIAVTSLVGRYIGQRRRDLVHARVRAALVITMVYMGLCGLLWWVCRRPMVEFYLGHASSSGDLAQALAERYDDIVRIGGYVLIAAAVFQVFDAIGIVYTGALRGAGDTLWPAMVQVALVLVMLIGGGWATLTLMPRWESPGIWGAAGLYIAVFGLMMGWRFNSEHWRKINLLGQPVPEAVATPVPDGVVVAVEPADGAPAAGASIDR